MPRVLIAKFNGKNLATTKENYKAYLQFPSTGHCKWNTTLYNRLLLPHHTVHMKYSIYNMTTWDWWFAVGIHSLYVNPWQQTVFSRIRKSGVNYVILTDLSCK